MKKSFFKILALSIICLVSLTSCSVLEILGEILQSLTEGNTNQNQISFDSSNFVYDEKLNNVELVIEEGKAGRNTTLKELKDKEGITVFPSLGEQKLLVIPCYFSDFKPEDTLQETKEEARQNIYNAFFGSDSSSTESDKTGWESVSSYYTKSSYGKLHITGEVTDWFPIGEKLKDVALSNSFNYPSTGILRKAVDWFKKNNSAEKIAEYDLNKDGYFDGVVLVYANPYYSNNSNYYAKYATDERTKSAINDLCWAFTTWDNAKSSYISPVAKVYMWASYSFLWDGGYKESNSILSINNKKLVDAHTYIHEFGHMLGLDDYYSYDKNDKTSPIGRLDMMDYNIGDHNSYSKYLLDWIEPTLVSKEGMYEISSFAETGNALLIPAASLDNYSYSAFDEYILIELYTPTVNNYNDAKNKYCGNLSQYPYFYTKVGIRMFHVDSRLIVFNKMTKKYSFSKTAKNLTSYQEIQIAASNTPSYSISPSFKLISLISRRGINDYFKKDGYAKNNDLFYASDAYQGLNFDNGEKLQYEILISQIDSNEKKAQIQINKIDNEVKKD